MPTASIVVPAHNEQGRIGATLRALLADAAAGEFDIVVVCNGCTDRTADEAGAVDGVRVLELPEGSKIAALRAGDASTDIFPRIYLDADVVLHTDGARALVDVLDESRPLAASLVASYALEGAPLGVQLYVEFRQRLPVFADGFIGAGVYAMNRAGRSRFDLWPAVLGDDQFVYRLFSEQERVTVRDHSTLVEAPHDLREVVRRGVRVRRGNAELTAGSADVDGMTAPRAGVRTALVRSIGSPRRLISALVFVGVTVTIRILTAAGGRGDWAARQDT